MQVDAIAGTSVHLDQDGRGKLSSSRVPFTRFISVKVFAPQLSLNSGWLAGFLLSLIFTLCTGCAGTKLARQAVTPSYDPANVYREEANLPASIRRIALLPLTSATESADLAFGLESMRPVIQGAFAGARQFEMVVVSGDELRLLTGRASWNADDRLPADFLDKLRDKLAVDAVLFCSLTTYRAYEPLAIGWRIKLVDIDEPRVLWAVDELFDARVPEVAAGAVRFAERHPDTGSSLQDSRSILISARRFGHYAATELVRTMPGRTLAEAD